MMMATPCSISHAWIMKRTLHTQGRELPCPETVADEKTLLWLINELGWVRA